MPWVSNPLEQCCWHLGILPVQKAFPTKSQGCPSASVPARPAPPFGSRRESGPHQIHHVHAKGMEQWKSVINPPKTKVLSNEKRKFYPKSFKLSEDGYNASCYRMSNYSSLRHHAHPGLGLQTIDTELVPNQILLRFSWRQGLTYGTIHVRGCVATESKPMELTWWHNSSLALKTLTIPLYSSRFRRYCFRSLLTSMRILSSLKSRSPLVASLSGTALPFSSILAELSRRNIQCLPASSPMISRATWSHCLLISFWRKRLALRNARTKRWHLMTFDLYLLINNTTERIFTE